MTGETPTQNINETKHLHSDDKINYVELSDDPTLLQTLAEKLSVSGSYNVPYKKESIMKYGAICEHDSGYLCKHRLLYILNFISKNKLK